MARYDPSASADASRLPGATTSGFSTRSNSVGPREDYFATVSSDRFTVSCMSTAPTVSAAGSLPGEVEDAVRETRGVRSAIVELTWDPPFTLDRVSDEVKLMLGLL